MTIIKGGIGGTTQEISGMGTVWSPPNAQVVTAQPASSGWLGNVWDVVKKTAGAVIQTGTNILLQKAQDKFAQPVQPVAGYPPFAQKQQSPEIVYNPKQTPTSKFATELFMSDSPIIKLLSPVIQPAVSEGIREGIVSVAKKPPVWVWGILGLLGVVIVMQGVKR